MCTMGLGIPFKAQLSESIDLFPAILGISYHGSSGRYGVFTWVAGAKLVGSHLLGGMFCFGPLYATTPNRDDDQMQNL